MVLINIWY